MHDWLNQAITSTTKNFINTPQIPDSSDSSCWSRGISNGSINRSIKGSPSTSLMLFLDGLTTGVLLLISPEGSELEKHTKEGKDTNKISIHSYMEVEEDNQVG